MNKNTTNQIIIEIDDYEKAEHIFNEIQNRHNFYDNCILVSNVSESNSIIDPVNQNETGNSLIWKRK